jgi:Zn-dependent oligopeptidase
MALTVDRKHKRPVELDESLYARAVNGAVDGLKDGNGGLRFDHTAEEIYQMTDDILRYQRGVVDDIVSTLDRERNFENVARPFALKESNGGTVELVLGVYADVSPSATIRDAASLARAKFDVFENQLFLSNELYQAFLDAKNNLQESGEWDDLTKEDRKYLNKILREFIQDGMLLTRRQRKKLAKLQKKSDGLQHAAFDNLAADHSKVEVSPE